MKDQPTLSKSFEVEAAPFFVLRTALFPFDEWLQFADGVTAPTASDDALEAALAADRQRARERLRALVARPELREALFVASPSLEESIDLWMSAPESERGLKAERSMLRYLSRMCGRSTPFGLFAGCTVGCVGGAATKLRLAPRNQYRRHTRLDMDYLFALSEALAKDPELRARLRYRPSTSQYRASGQVRYVEARLDGKNRSYHLVAVEKSEYIDATLARAEKGAFLGDLVRALALDAEVSDEEAREFIDELVTKQLLVAELQVPVTGPEPVHALLTQLDGHAAHGPLAATRDALAAIDDEPLGVKPARYRDIAAGLEALPVEVELSRLFQIDMMTRGEELTLGGGIAREIERAVTLAHKLARRNDALTKFRDAFTERYEAAEVPLAEVLDEECGIGFARSSAPTADASPLIAGLAFPPGNHELELRWGARELFLFAKLTAALQSGAREIVIDEKALDDAGVKDRPPLPDSFAVMVALDAESEAALDEGRYRLHLGMASGPSSANLLGRFCHGDPELAGRVRDEVRFEESHRPGAIFAEVVHLPEGRVGNVLLRPLLRAYELPYLGASGAPADKQIGLDDLTVTVDGDRVVLRSRRLGREVIPRLSTAHNHSNPASLGVYRFLCQLQGQGVASTVGWNWSPFESAPFLPRVVSGRIVLAPARWRLERVQLEALGAAKGVERWRAVQNLRATLGLPRFIAVEDGDNKLPIDLDHTLAVDNFVHLVKRRHGAVLTEMQSELPVRGPEGRFVHEIVLPFRRNGAATTILSPSPPTSEPKSTSPTSNVGVRRAAPATDCLYVKLYCGAAAVDRVLRDVIEPIVRKARATGGIDRWFFIRYGDPDWHLRLRFFGDPERLTAEVEPAIWRAADELLAEGRLWRAQQDTYHRELERYGGPVGMRLCEEFFCADSDAALAIIAALEGDAGADARWRLVVRGIDMLLDDLGFDLDAKHGLLVTLRDGFCREFSVDVGFERQLGDRFRRERTSLETLLSDPLADDHPLAPGVEFLRTRSGCWAPIAADLVAAAKSGQLTTSLPNLASSLVHLHANRLLRASARANELVIYDLLARLYQGRRARKKH